MTEAKKDNKPKMTTDIHLDFPIEVDGADVSKLTMRRAKVRDHKQAGLTAGTNQQDYEIHLFANLCDLPVESFDDMDYADYEKVQEAYRGFLSSKTTTK
tara:strand:- start:182 stop:478 length:297 start_codon:yes stop_codon:yes gene_type:complete